MTLEKQVCSLELAKKLKELGFPQESYFVWVDKFPIFNDKEKLVSVREFKDRLAVSLLSEEARKLVKTYSAYTVAELGEMLPVFTTSCYNGVEYIVRNDQRKELTSLDFCSRHSLADAMSKMLIYLKENNLI